VYLYEIHLLAIREPFVIQRLLSLLGIKEILFVFIFFSCIFILLFPKYPLVPRNLITPVFLGLEYF
jgi:hypothetical protein